MPEPAVAGDAFVIAWTGVDADRRRYIFQPQEEGDYHLIEERQNCDGVWVGVGSETVANVELKHGAEVLP